MNIRCSSCNKKISIIEQEYCKCKCDEMFCPKHRSPIYKSSEMGHLCSFDYVTDNQNKLSKILNDQIVKKDIISI